tara:strand:+ start:1574 stop:1993 length:420 start_codon:yes stop_codon:yes gene_type:complete
MRSYTVEIETDLPELVHDAIEEIKRVIGEFVSSGDIDESMDSYAIDDVLDYDGIKTQIIDGMVPVYTYDLEALFYVHKRVLLDAFHDAGICEVREVISNPDSFPLGIEGLAIFCYIEQFVNAWMYDDMQDWFNEKFGGN